MANQDSGHMIRSRARVMFRIIVAALRIVVRSSLRSGLVLVMSLHHLDRDTDHHCAGVVLPPRPPRSLHLLPGALVPDAESGCEIRIGQPHNVIHDPCSGAWSGSPSGAGQGHSGAWSGVASAAFRSGL